MFGLGTSELLVVLALALIFIGPEKLPQIATTLGQAVKKLKEAIDDIKSEIK
ncbi:MAG: twin-arginine translocase TatA/TatE family subunit [Deltaproteobacteria bacterium]|nr:twin-arginine translocase TatA/TatE family subunit [Deltaproteobacteria bacterium]